jgi:membrane-associated protein
MEWISNVVDLFLHLDEHLGDVIRDYGVWTYVILVAIIFCETGLVVTPFLPGDSLLFAAGTLSAALGTLNIHLLFVLLWIAAVVGDSVNYAIGAAIGPRAFSGKIWLLNQNHLERTRQFYEKHGGKTIILARFVPIVRTFAPFVAGVGAMNYGRFLLYNVVGGLAWVGGFLYLGYFFGNIPVVKENFSFVVLGIIFISILPIVYEFVMARRRPKVDETVTVK